MVRCKSYGPLSDVWLKTKWAIFAIIIKAMVRAPLVKHTLNYSDLSVMADVVKQPYLLDFCRPSDLNMPQIIGLLFGNA